MLSSQETQTEMLGRRDIRQGDLQKPGVEAVLWAGFVAHVLQMKGGCGGLCLAPCCGSAQSSAWDLGSGRSLLLPLCFGFSVKGRVGDAGCSYL